MVVAIHSAYGMSKLVLTPGLLADGEEFYCSTELHDVANNTFISADVDLSIKYKFEEYVETICPAHTNESHVGPRSHLGSFSKTILIDGNDEYVYNANIEVS